MADVVIDKTRVARRPVEAFAQVLEEDRQEHCADRHTYDRQTTSWLRLPGKTDQVISRWSCGRRHSAPRPVDAIPVEEFRISGFSFNPLSSGF